MHKGVVVILQEAGIYRMEGKSSARKRSRALVRLIARSSSQRNSGSLSEPKLPRCPTLSHALSAKGAGTGSGPI